MLAPSNPRKFKIFAVLAGLALVALCGLLYFSLGHKAPMPEVTFVNLQGEKITSQSLRGKVVMVNFWATSCETCIKEMPRMVDTFNKYHAEGLEYMAVAMQDDPANYVINYTETRKLPFQVSLDVEGKLAKAFGNVRMTPTTFVIDRQGNILKRYLGEPSQAELHALLDQALRA
jgi:peroxiredoxin